LTETSPAIHKKRKRNTKKSTTYEELNKKIKHPSKTDAKNSK
jgi:hypothetical protein